MWNILDGFRNDVIKVVSEYETEVSGSNGTHNIEAKFQGKLNLNNQEKKTVVDYVPFNFFKEDLLIRLDNSWFQRTAFVVSILEKKNSRWAAGHLKLFPDKNKEWALFSPNDSRLPRIKVKVEQCPPGKNLTELEFIFIIYTKLINNDFSFRFFNKCQLLFEHIVHRSNLRHTN
jgi:hypothetical protein